MRFPLAFLAGGCGMLWKGKAGHTNLAHQGSNPGSATEPVTLSEWLLMKETPFSHL